MITRQDVEVISSDGLCIRVTADGGVEWEKLNHIANVHEEDTVVEIAQAVKDYIQKGSSIVGEVNITVKKEHNDGCWESVEGELYVEKM